MEDKLKYRLVGAAVIIAIAAFFLPLILDSEKYRKEIVSQIPPMPEVKTEPAQPLQESATTEVSGQRNEKPQEKGSLVINLDEKFEPQVDNTKDSATDASDVNSQVKVAENSQENKTQASKSVANQESSKKPETATNQAVKVDNKSETNKTAATEDKIKEAAKQATKVAQKVEPPKAKPETKTKPIVAKAPTFKEKAYVIQIGTFSNKDNAKKLVSDLRKQEFRAYQRVDKDYARVYVGPYPEKKLAESRSDKLADIVGNSVKVIEFDPIAH
ncbi:SPOR domain-containing protein [Kangiella sp. TOML190]|uniref:SPOR domain-containing protein n=1 Tax=Kangiella sp. TOML190 TaxID=2931351 RepID=UPI00203AB22F|nr:SPOR domain-containing protein [Kangiella sp. TOML190]